MVLKRFSAPALERYLRRTGLALRRPRSRRLQGAPLLVMGSEAGDLDSLVCSLCYAELLAAESPQRLVVPLIPLFRRDLRLRPEAVFLLRRLGLGAGLLPFRDEPAAAVLLSAPPGGEAAEVVLVDTCRLPLESERELRIVEVVDHHPEQRHAGPAAPRRRLTEHVGSAATLVWEELRRRRPELLEPGAAALLLAAILLDTVNLDARAGRGTARDARAAGWLSEAAGLSTADYFSRLHRERLRLGHLKAGELLRRDLKEQRGGGTAVGVSSLLLSGGLWQRRVGPLARALPAFCAARDLDLAVVMAVLEDGQAGRRLLAYSSRPQVLAAALRLLETLPMGLSGEPIPQGSPDGAVLFRQREVGFSRKQLLPHLRELGAEGGR